MIMKNNSLGSLVFDIEANGLNPDKVWCIVAKDVRFGHTHKFDVNNIKQGISLLNKTDTLIGHNILGYDLPVLEKLYNFKYKGKVIDTLVLSRLFNPVRDNGHSLESWGQRLGTNKLDKPDFSVYSPEMLTYCERDVALNDKVYKALLREGKGFSVESIDLEHEVAKILNQQEQHGFLFDEQAGTMLVATLKEKMFETEEEVQKVFTPKIIKDKLVVTKFKKDGSLSRVGLTPQ